MVHHEPGQPGADHERAHPYPSQEQHRIGDQLAQLGPPEMTPHLAGRGHEGGEHGEHGYGEEPSNAHSGHGPAGEPRLDPCPYHIRLVRVVLDHATTLDHATNLYL